MTVKNKLQEILNEISKFEDAIEKLDTQLGLQHYSVCLSNRIIPYAIEVQRKPDFELVASFEVIYDEAIPLTMDFRGSMESEISELINQPANSDPDKRIKLSELFKICQAFGFPNYLVLGKPYPIAGNTGDILTIYMDYIGSHSDLYLRCKLLNPGGHIYIKADQKALLDFLNNKLALQDVFNPSPETFFYVQHNNNIQEEAIEVPGLLNNYSIMHPDVSMSQLPQVNLHEIDRAIADQMNYIKQDTFGEENWLDNEPISKIILIKYE